jgi:hypothetical protein
MADKAHQFQKGNPGKPKGAISHLTRTVKETVLAVFNDLQEDPQANLTTWAKSEPTEFYKIAAKLIPTEVKADVKTVQKITLNIVRTNSNTTPGDTPPEPAEGAGHTEAV